MAKLATFAAIIALFNPKIIPPPVVGLTWEATSPNAINPCLNNLGMEPPRVIE